MTKHYLKILEEIYLILENNGFEKEKIHLKNEVSSGSTGGEIISMIGSTLLSFKRNQRLNLLLENQTSEFIKYCHNNNIYPKERNITD